MLDPPNLPDKKTNPPRLLILVLGAVLSFSFGIVWLLGSAVWRETDSQNPAKAFLRDVYAGVKTDIRLVSSNGSRLGQIRDKILKFKSHQ